ncbi:ABC transporter ATP-binding protein [candidate division WOR-3 bacterium]|nr:ABC transporter ATP-binding protein [candidate division WOR-3 bacterium]
MKAVELCGLGFGYAGVPLFAGFDLAVEPGEFLGVIGPNGAGKSTLLRLMAGILRPESGRAAVLGHDLGRTPRLQAARLVAVVPQESHFAFDYTVRDVVLMGRHPWLGRFESPGPADRRVVAAALDFCDVTALADKSINETSAGEKQRVLLARALAQEPEVLLLDEATSHLDIGHQYSIASLLGRLNRQGKTVVFLSHDLNLAALCCRRVLLLAQGRAVACDVPERVICRELIARVYGMEPLVTVHPETGRPQVLLPATGEPAAAESSRR